MITSSSNSQMKQIVKLHKSARERKKTDSYLVEGLRMFLEVPPERLIKAYATEAFYEAHRSLFSDKPYELVGENVFKAMSDTIAPQGILCVVEKEHWQLDTLLETEKPLFIALENIQDPGNLGTIIRTAEGAGADGIIMSRDTVDIYNSKTVRATMGSIFRVPFVYVEDMVQTVGKLEAAGIRTYAGHLQGLDMYAEDYTGATAFFIGNEGNGLSKDLADAVSSRIRIPMKGKVESLNAAAAAAVLMYETMRQRTLEKC